MAAKFKSGSQAKLRENVFLRDKSVELKKDTVVTVFCCSLYDKVNLVVCGLDGNIVSPNKNLDIHNVFFINEYYLDEP